jgi:hypothetical protein
MSVFEELKIVRESVEFSQVAPLANQQITRAIIDARELIHDVADVGAQAVIPGATDIDGHTHIV